MKLVQLFEAIGDLIPGEKRIAPDMQLRDLEQVHRRIMDLTNAIEKSEELMAMFKKDKELQTKLTGLVTRVNRRIEILNKVRQRPTAGMLEMFEKLDTECSEFIPAMQQAGKFLYRGVKNHEHAFEGRSREDREPKDSDKQVSETFDRMMSELGVQALRSNSIYTTSSYGFASMYGWEVYIIFPKNGFDFLSTNQRDLILEKWHQLVDMEQVKERLVALNDWAKQNIESWDFKSLANAIKYREWDYALKLLLDNWKFDDNDLGLPEEYNWQIDQLVTPQSVQMTFDPNTTDLVSAIKSGNECLIRGEYWALNKKQWEGALRAKYLPGSYTDQY